MDALTRYATRTNAKDLPTPGWLVALGILLLASTVLHDISGLSLADSVELTEKAIGTLSIVLNIG